MSTLAWAACHVCGKPGHAWKAVPWTGGQSWLVVVCKDHANAEHERVEGHDG